MKLAELTALSPLDGRYAKKVAPLRAVASEYGLIRFRLLVEIRWLMALSENTQIVEIPAFSATAYEYLQHIYDSFGEKEALEIKNLEATTNHDVKALEYFLKEKLSLNSEHAPFKEFVHFACTSEDINNLAYGLMLKTLRDDHLLPNLKNLLHLLEHTAREEAHTSMLSRTHGQAASPTTLGKEFANFAFRLKKQMHHLQNISIMGKCNGAVGNFNAHVCAYPEVNWPLFTKQFIQSLGLSFNPYTTQIEPHDFIADFCTTLSHCNTILIDFAQDSWGYISLGYFIQQNKAGEVGSSTMPHKINPIDFENAEGNLGLSNALLSYFAAKLPISRWQRDLSDSTVLRNLGVSVGYAYLAYHSLIAGLGKLSVNHDQLNKELESHWEVLAEPIQTIMRRYGIMDAYEQLKAFTRGQVITKKMLHEFIKAQTHLPHAQKEKLLSLTPQTYAGLAAELALEIEI